MIRGLFWAAAASLTYSYVLFPALVFLRAAIRPRPHEQADLTPSVSIIVPARNEAARIASKLESIRLQNYPRDQIEVVVVSDGSDDGTPDIVRGRHLANTSVLDLDRVGKAEALRAGVAASKGEILVFSDANSVFAPDALRRLVRPFADQSVGGVAGNQIYRSEGTADATATGERSYWDIDRVLKAAQSRAGNVIAATGSLYAIRRQLFRPIPRGVTDDFYLSLVVIDAGFRLVFEPTAVAYEDVAPSRAVEYGRKVRIMTRGLRCVAVMPRLLDPRRSGFYAVQLLSHKVLMRLMAFPLLVLGVTSLLLAPRSRLYALVATGQVSFYSLAVFAVAVAHKRVGRFPVFALPAYFVLVQAASLHATWNLLRGQVYERWEPLKRATPMLAQVDARGSRR